MIKKVKIKEYVKYKGHSVRQNGIVSLKLEANYGEAVNSMQVLQLLNNDVSIKAKLGEDTCNLGVFRVKNVAFAGDGVSTLQFTSSTESVELDNINLLCDVETEEFCILMLSNVELEDNEGGE